MNLIQRVKCLRFSESGVSMLPLGGSNAQNCEIPTKSGKSEMQLENDASKSFHADEKLNVAYMNYQSRSIKYKRQTDVITEVDEDLEGSNILTLVGSGDVREIDSEVKGKKRT
ncbi:Hypothetical predicted protein [Olea europaea subsp. europaea]|uniref:Uncharacterized protein n=1 Tax=Olea europaea subsp. europaea TaxID=158383 RepID=A0A8S0VJB3_OLEEU|nr:Hypothetical predicted protein [Olea europaea subsp. europaea]